MFKKKHTFNLEIGNVVISLTFPKQGYVDFIKDYLNTKSCENPGDISLYFEIYAFNDNHNIPDSLFTTKKVKNNRFSIDNDLIKGVYYPIKRKGKLKIKYILTRGLLTRVLEQIFYQAYYSAVQAKNLQSYLLHSSGVIKDGKGYLFVGKSGEGKSTVAELSQKYLVLNDEINILEIDSKKQEIQIFSSLINGHYKNKKPGLKAPLKAIFLLNQAPHHSIEKMKTGLMIKTISREIVPPIGLIEELQPDTFIKMIDIAQHISRFVPIYQLDFLPDDGFWKVIEDLESKKKPE